MSCIKTGARVFFENYGCVCSADLYGIPGTDAVVIRTNGPMDETGSYSPEAIQRATHKVRLFVGDPGFWRPDLGTYAISGNLLETLPTTEKEKTNEEPNQD